MVLVVWHLRPDLLLTPTITTGGDTASHYYTAWWLRHELLPSGRLTGWVPGNYAGFPLFQVYFPLPFVLMAALSLLTGLPVAFKLLTVAGLVGLPLSAYWAFRLLRFDFPTPALAAAFSVAFLFHEADSVWGANIASTLAGEFTYSFGTALLVVFAGTLYRGVVSGRGAAGNGLLLAAIGLSHAYTLLAAAAFGAYLVLCHPDGRRGLPYLVTVGLIAFGLMAFWVLPLLAFSEYTTGYSIIWPIGGLTHVVPVILWPFAGLLAAGLLAAIRHRVGRRNLPGGRTLDHRVPYLLSLAAGAGLLYLSAWKLDVVDIRFLPFVQLTIALVAAVPAAGAVRAVSSRLGSRSALGAVVLAAVAAGTALGWSHRQVTIARDWSAWNYGGFERAPGWPAYRGVNDAVRRTWADPRVAYEHSPAHNDTGTIRAFESLPLFSGASTLEGLYMQSTISSPFVFYIQSEISELPSCPLLPYHCGRLDAARAAEHLRLYNVSDVITRSDRVTTALASSSEFSKSAEVPPYTVFHLAGTPGTYVEPLRFEPVVIASENWKADFFAWFKRPGSGDVPIVRAGQGDTAGAGWAQVTSLPDRMPRLPLPEGVVVTSELEPEEIRIHTSRPGHPLLVKVSYHPRWHVEGADAVWLASPSFMLLVPRQPDVRLVYGPTAIDRAGAAITGLALLSLAVAGLRWTRRRRARRDDTGREPLAQPSRTTTDRHALDRVFAARRRWAPAVVVALVLGSVGARLDYTDPWIPHREGLERFTAGNYAAAEPLLAESMALAPSSSAAYYSFYYFALSAHRSGRWEEAIARFSRFRLDYPDGEHVAEAGFRIAESLDGLDRTDEAVHAYLDVIDRFSDTRWAGFAATRLTAITAAYDQHTAAASDTRDEGGSP